MKLEAIKQYVETVYGVSFAEDNQTITIKGLEADVCAAMAYLKKLGFTVAEYLKGLGG